MKYTRCFICNLFMKKIEILYWEWKNLTLKSPWSRLRLLSESPKWHFNAYSTTTSSWTSETLTAWWSPAISAVVGESLNSRRVIGALPFPVASDRFILRHSDTLGFSSFIINKVVVSGQGRREGERDRQSERLLPLNNKWHQSLSADWELAAALLLESWNELKKTTPCERTADRRYVPTWRASRAAMLPDASARLHSRHIRGNRFRGRSWKAITGPAVMSVIRCISEDEAAPADRPVERSHCWGAELVCPLRWVWN